MNFAQVLSIVGTIPLFSMRTFFPAFLTVLFFTHPELFPGVSDAPQSANEMSFWAENWLLMVLGVLSILEFIGDKNPDIKYFLRAPSPDNDFTPLLQPPTLLLIGGLILFFSITGPWEDHSLWFVQGEGNTQGCRLNLAKGLGNPLFHGYAVIDKKLKPL